MGALSEALADDTRRKAVVADCVQLIEDEVGRKRGLRGMALKTGYKTVKALRPGIIGHATNRLLPDFAPAIDPFYDKGIAAGDLQRYFASNDDAIAEALLGVTDGHAQRATNRVMIRVYKTLRGAAKDHVKDAVPGLARVVAKHCPA